MALVRDVFGGVIINLVSLGGEIDQFSGTNSNGFFAWNWKSLGNVEKVGRNDKSGARSSVL